MLPKSDGTCARAPRTYVDAIGIQYSRDDRSTSASRAAQIRPLNTHTRKGIFKLFVRQNGHFHIFPKTQRPLAAAKGNYRPLIRHFGTRSKPIGERERKSLWCVCVCLSAGRCTSYTEHPAAVVNELRGGARRTTAPIDDERRTAFISLQPTGGDRFTRVGVRYTYTSVLVIGFCVCVRDYFFLACQV